MTAIFCTPCAHAGCIHVSETTYQLLPNHTFSSTGMRQHSFGFIVLRCFPDLRESGVHTCHCVMLQRISCSIRHVLARSAPVQHLAAGCCTGGINVKGKGLMKTYLWNPSEHPEEAYVSSQEHQQEATALVNHISKQLPGDASPVAKVQTALDTGALKKALQALESSRDAAAHHAGTAAGSSRVPSPPLSGRAEEVRLIQGHGKSFT